MSKNFAHTLLEHIPEDDTYTSLRGMIGLYIDELLTREQLTQQPIYVSFVNNNKKFISELLFDEQLGNKQSNEIKSVHFNHHTSNIFKQLGNKASESGKTEYCKIKLASASGMTELPQTINWYEVIELVKDLLSTQSNSSVREKTLDLIQNTLAKNGLLDRYNPENSVYRIGISLSSKKEICISIEHDTEKTESGFNGYLFSLSSDRQVIIDILERYGYEADNEIEEMFGPIIIIKKDDLDNDEFDYV